jgi:predicted kinase
MKHSGGRLIIVCGLPGSGKTTVATELTEQLGGMRFSPDDWMEALAIDIWDSERRQSMEDLQWQVARDVLRLGGVAILEWGTWAREERDRLRREARELGAAVELVYLTAPVDQLYDRIQRRGRENPPISKQMLEESAAAFEAPSAAELALYDPPAKAQPL